VEVGEPLYDKARALARRLADEFQVYPFVDAVTLSGSRTSGLETDARSDIDLFVYSDDGALPLAERQAIIERLGGAARANLGLTFWGPDGDVWFDARTGFEVDVVYSGKRWIEEALDRSLRRYQPSGGYSTCAWHTVRSAQILFDRSGWFGCLQAWSDQPYPPELRRAIVAHNLPVLRAMIPSYRYNVEKCLARGDLVFMNNEITWMLASYFDVLFAFNNVPHPGAKRLLEHAARLCPRRPPNLEQHVPQVLSLAALGDPAVLAAIDALVDGLEELVKGEQGLAF
jgi:predicted nucleotidyltransferase